jgi:hypothetical protein
MESFQTGKRAEIASRFICKVFKDETRTQNKTI